jgi:peptidylprolyl isomerase
MPPSSPARRRAAAAVALGATLLLAACGDADDDDDPAATSATSVPEMSLVPATQPSVPAVSLPAATPTELVVTQLRPGSGEPAEAGDTVYVHYVGVRSEDGEQFDTNFGSDPFPVTLGDGGVIAGWEQGLTGVTAGERVQLDIPADLAYGDQPSGDVIQPGDALTFVVDVLAVVPPTDPSAKPTASDLPASEAVSEPTTTDITPGEGDEAEVGSTAIAHITYFRADDQTELQSTWESQPASISISAGDLATDPSAAFVGMKVGGRRAIIVPAEQAGLDPAGDLVIIVDLLAVL